MTALEIINNGLYDAAVALMDDEIREEVHRNALRSLMLLVYTDDLIRDLA